MLSEPEGLQLICHLEQTTLFRIGTCPFAVSVAGEPCRKILFRNTSFTIFRQRKECRAFGKAVFGSGKLRSTGSLVDVSNKPGDHGE